MPKAGFLTESNLVSVVVPCYNQAHFLAEAIESVLAQTYQLFEVIVVNDGSTDNTQEVAGRYHGVRCISQKNLGLSAARNTGLAESRGEYLVFLDADDRLLPNALSIGVNMLQGHRECAFAAGHVRLISADGSPLPTSAEAIIEKNHYEELLRHNYIWTLAAAMYRRSVFESVGGFDSAVNPSADYDLNLRVARQFPIYCHGQVVAEYRRHGLSMTRDTVGMMTSVFTVLGSQRQYTMGNRQLQMAYKTGIRLYQSYYGNSMICELERHIADGEWEHMMQKMAALLRCCPQGLFRYFCPSVYCGVFRIRQTISCGIRKSWRLLAGKSVGLIRANPNPIKVLSGSWLGGATLEWSTAGTETVEVRAHAPDGPLLIRSGPSGSFVLEESIYDGMVFYLQDASDGLAPTSANTLSSLTVHLVSVERSIIDFLSRFLMFVVRRTVRKIYIL